MLGNTGEVRINEVSDAIPSLQNNKKDDLILVNNEAKKSTEEKTYKWDIVWTRVIVFIYLYIGTFYGLYLMIAEASWKTIVWSAYLVIIGVLGLTAGAHRLWTHRTYKAKLPLRILLAYFQTTCFQNDICEWVRDHRMHHKYTDTDADPHNATRGFFFSHIGWLMVRKHKEVREKGKYIYLKDLEEDPVVMFQKKYYHILMPLFCFVIPAVVPWYYWNEQFYVAWYVAVVGRYFLNLNGTWLVNSAAHLYGTRPYDKNIYPRENIFVGYLTLGEGWHNYHHAFPWDYKTSEFNGYLSNWTTGFVDLMATIGWAYDLKTASDEIVRKRMARTGDGSVTFGGIKMNEGEDETVYEDHMWGWGDETMSQELINDVKRYNKLKA